jgi:hypothetical protein
MSNIKNRLSELFERVKDAWCYGEICWGTFKTMMYGQREVTISTGLDDRLEWMEIVPPRDAAGEQRIVNKIICPVKGQPDLDLALVDFITRKRGCAPEHTRVWEEWTETPRRTLDKRMHDPAAYVTTWDELGDTVPARGPGGKMSP